MAEPIYQAPSAQGSSTAATAIQGASTAATAYKSPIDFSGLRARNPDVIGWIKIEGTRINYPIVQGTDNAKYLYTGADGAASTSGAVFLDYESDPGFDGYNNIIYAHNMKSGAMFHDLVQFKDKNFFNAHPYITIYTPTRTLRLKVISCYYAKAEAIYRKTKFTGTADFLSYMDQMISPCAFAEKPPVQVDSLYTLITCSYEFTDARTFLYAVEVDGSGNVVPAKQ
ncbi:MAG: class B sortase [Lachnospiraceae bacterium]|jgi:sortase B|nr:class B sortase [Lachnospiraceae bacterium]